MKKSTLEALYNLVNGNGTVTDELRVEITAEYERTTAKARANVDLYAAAHDVVMACTMWDKPLTVKEIFALVEDEMPDGFTPSKLQYAFRALWSEEIVKHDNGKSAFTYTRK